MESFDLSEAQVVSTSTSTVSLFMRPALIWFIIGFIMLILEFANPGFITFFFGIGAWVVAVLCLFAGISLNVQLTIFIVSSLLLLVSLRKWVRTTFIGYVTSKQKSDKIPEEFLGQKAVVTQQITPDRKGRIEFHGSNWDAESDETIPENTPVEIIGKESIILKVKSIKKE